MTEANDDAPAVDLGVSYYLFLGFSGLVVLSLALLDRLDIIGLIPAGIGAWPGDISGSNPFESFAPAALLRADCSAPDTCGAARIGLLVFILLGGTDRPARGPGAADLPERPVSIVRAASAAVPIDIRPRLDRPDGDLPESRPVEQVSPREPVRLIVVIAVCLILGQIAWQWVMSDWLVFGNELPSRLGLTNEATWRMISLIWLLGSIMVVLVGIFRLLRYYRMSRDEAAMIAVDTLWTETRGEQRRIARWTAWRRRKSERESEKQS